MTATSVRILAVKQRIIKAIDKSRTTAALLSAETNPQSIEVRNKALGKVAALEAVLEALRGDMVSLNILCE